MGIGSFFRVGAVTFPNGALAPDTPAATDEFRLGRWDNPGIVPCRRGKIN
jgi:hypothetical protein